MGQPIVNFEVIGREPQKLRKAESLGGKRVVGPLKNPGRDLVVAHFTDPEGNLIGLAGPK